MPLLWSLFAILIFYATVFSSNQFSQNQATADGEVAAIAGSMMVYRNHVAAYAAANTWIVGTAADVSLGLPSWYVKPSGLSNYLVTGNSYVYYSTALPGLASALAHKTESINVGSNAGGILNSPNVGNTGIVLPAQIPASAVVIIQ